MSTKKDDLCYVMNTKTGWCRAYTLPPRDAVKAAYLQDRGDFNTWDYDKKDVPLEEDPVFFRCGVFEVRKKS